MPRSSPAPSSRAPAAKETTVIVIRKRRVDPAEEGPRRAGLPAWRLAHGFSAFCIAIRGQTKNSTKYIKT